MFLRPNYRSKDGKDHWSLVGNAKKRGRRSK
jgi:hypothetical protein